MLRRVLPLVAIAALASAALVAASSSPAAADQAGSRASARGASASTSSRLPFRRLTAEEVRAAAQQAAQQANGDADRFDALVSSALAKLVPGISLKPTPVAAAPGLTITASGPAFLFLRDAREFVRRFEPIGYIMWHPYVVVAVTPSTVKAPNIERVVVMRDGAIVPPLESLLVPGRITSDTGVQKNVMRGAVTYPPSAFDPGKPVKVVAVPADGHNLVAVMSQADLLRLQ